MLPDAAAMTLTARSPPPPAAAGRTAPGHARFVPVARSVFEFPGKSAYKLPMEQALTGGRVPCGACRATELGTNAMTMLDRIGDILRAAKVALAGAPDGGASDIRSPDGLTTGDDAGAIISRVAGSPGRRVAGSPGRRVAGSPGRRVAGSPGRRVAGSPGRRVAGSPGRRVAGSPGRRVAGSPGRRVAGSPGRRVAPPASALRHERVRMAAAPLPSVLSA